MAKFDTDWMLTPYKPDPNSREDYAMQLDRAHDLQADVIKAAVKEEWTKIKLLYAMGAISEAVKTFDEADFPDFSKSQASVVLAGCMKVFPHMCNTDRQVVGAVDNDGILTVYADSTPEGQVAFTLRQLIHFYMHPYYKPEPDPDELFPTFESLTGLKK